MCLSHFLKNLTAFFGEIKHGWGMQVVPVGSNANGSPGEEFQIGNNWKSPYWPNQVEDVNKNNLDDYKKKQAERERIIAEQKVAAAKKGTSKIPDVPAEVTPPVLQEPTHEYTWPDVFRYEPLAGMNPIPKQEWPDNNDTVGAPPQLKFGTPRAGVVAQQLHRFISGSILLICGTITKC